jgi:hypothetical protein
MCGDSERGKYRVYRCLSRQTPHGFCGSKRVHAADCENMVWEQVNDILNDSSFIAEEIERRKSAGEDTRSKVLADVEAARRELKRVEVELGRLVARAGSAEDDLWELFEKEISGKREAK